MAAALADTTPSPTTAPVSTSATQNNAVSGDTELVTPSDSGCVMCQYWLEHIHTNMAIASRKGIKTSDGMEETPFESKILNRAQPIGTDPFSTMDDSASRPDAAVGEMAEDFDESMGFDDFDHMSLIESSEKFGPRDGYPYRPRQVRYSKTKTHETAHGLQKVLTNTVYATLEENCNEHLASPYFRFCQDMIRKYRNIVELMPYDRNDEICMKIKMCDSNSYIKNSPHAITVDLE